MLHFSFPLGSGSLYFLDAQDQGFDFLMRVASESENLGESDCVAEFTSTAQV
jgi:hypothetical protein